MKLLRVFCGVLALVVGAQPALAKRVALVIGNSNYGGELALRNPANDARAVAQSLRSLQFTVIERLDQNLAGMEEALVRFNETLEKGDVAWFFYAGHGLQDQNVNYLVPIGADVKASFELKRKTMDLNTIKDAMMDSGARLNVVVLDCCRDNPLTRSFKNKTRSLSRGLASIQDVPDGMIVAYSTAANTTALDGEGANSPYTANLVNVLNSRPEGGLGVKQIFFSAGQAVKKSIDQRPYLELDATMESYYLDRDVTADTSLAATGAGVANAVAVQAGGTMPLAPTPVPGTMAMPPQPQIFPIPGNNLPPAQVVYVTPPGVVNSAGGVFANGPYAGYNAWTQKSILKKVQEKLKGVGLYQGGIDGGMGPGTQTAINAWQQNNGLAVTGLLDQPTLQHMMLLGLAETTAQTTQKKYSGGNSSKSGGSYNGGSSGEKKSGSWLDSTGGRIFRGRFGIP